MDLKRSCAGVDLDLQTGELGVSGLWEEKVEIVDGSCRSVNDAREVGRKVVIGVECFWSTGYLSNK